MKTQISALSKSVRRLRGGCCCCIGGGGGVVVAVRGAGGGGGEGIGVIQLVTMCY